MYRKCLLYWGALLLVLGLSPTTSNRPRTTGPPGTLAAAVQNRTGSTNTGPVTRVPSGLATDSDKASKPVVPKRLLVDGFPKEPLALENGEHGQEDDWVKTLVLTVRNVSGKPIYFAEYTVTLPEIRVAGGPLQIPILYGNPALRSAALPGPKDKPLGENKVIKLRI